MKFTLFAIFASSATASMMGGNSMIGAASCPACADPGPSANAALLGACAARSAVSDKQCGILMTSLPGPVPGCTCYNFCGTEFVGCDAPLSSCTAGAPVNGCTADDVNQALLIPTPAPVSPPNREGCGACPPNAVALVPCVKTPFNFQDASLSECQCEPNYILDSGRCMFCSGCAPGSTPNEFIFNRDGCIVDSDQFCYAGANLVAPVAPVPAPVQPVPAPVPAPVAPIPAPVPAPVAPIPAPVLTCTPPLVVIGGGCGCPPPLVMTAMGTCDCPQGTILQNGQCVAPVQSCQPGQIFNAQFNACFPAPVPRPAPVAQPVPQPVPQPIPQPVANLVQPVAQPVPQPVPVAQVLTLPTFPPRGTAQNLSGGTPTAQNIFGGDDDDDDCSSGKGKGGKGGSSGGSSCGKSGKGGKGKGGSSRESVESGLVSGSMSTVGVVGALLASALLGLW